MSNVSTYLMFADQTEAAFEFYKAAFSTDYARPPMRFGDVPAGVGVDVADQHKQLIMHIALPILGGHLLMGSDMAPDQADGLVAGTNYQIALGPDTKAEADRLWAALSAGGTDLEPMRDEFWGDYYGSFTDKFDVRWMLVVSNQPS